MTPVKIPVTSQAPLKNLLWGKIFLLNLKFYTLVRAETFINDALAKSQAFEFYVNFTKKNFPSLNNFFPVNFG